MINTIINIIKLFRNLLEDLAHYTLLRECGYTIKKVIEIELCKYRLREKRYESKNSKEDTEEQDNFEKTEKTT